MIYIGLDMSCLLMQFMRCVLADNVIVTSWGIADIRVSIETVSFAVDGFLFKGRIFVVSSGGRLLLSSSMGTIGGTSSPEAAVQMLDEYIESGGEYLERIIDLVKNQLV